MGRMINSPVSKQNKSKFFKEVNHTNRNFEQIIWNTITFPQYLKLSNCKTCKLLLEPTF